MFHNDLLLLNIVVCILVFFRLCRMVANENKSSSGWATVKTESLVFHCIYH
ncbi:hypothetical protein M758_5G046200 [Ceratodon purpureus]|nr:hypothetical protein M758_5G046200 [Ceratodon purpureus]